MGNELDQQQFTGIYTMPVTVLLNSQILQKKLENTFWLLENAYDS